MEQESRGVLIISVPAPQGQGAGKKQWEFLAGSGDPTLLPPEHGTRIDIPAPGLQPQQPGPRLWARQFWARSGGGGFGGAVARVRRKRLLFVSFLLALVVLSWLRAPAFLRNESRREQDDEDEVTVYPLMWSRWYGNPGEGTTRPEERSTAEALLDLDANRNAARASFLGLGQGNFSRPGRALLSVSATERTNIAYQMGQSPEMYYIAMQIGRAGNSYNLGIDTGGHLSWLLCDSNCSGCPVAPHRWYKPESARLVAKEDQRCVQVAADGGIVGGSKYQSCTYMVGYYDKSTTAGYLVQDVLSYNGRAAPPLNAWVTFGCSVQQGGLLARSPASEDGLLALSKSPMAMSNQLAPFFANSVFGHCMSVGGGGYLFFGGLAAKTLAWTPYNSDLKTFRSLYVVDLDSTYYGNSPLFPGFPVYIDSGSAHNYLAAEEYSALVSLLRDQVPLEETPQNSEPYPVCWRGSTSFRSLADASKYFKTLKLGFKQNWADPSPLPPYMELDPQGYLKITRSGSVCLAFLEIDMLTAGPAKMTIGAQGLRGYSIVYDNQRKRLGWARNSCTVPNGNPKPNSNESQRQAK